MKGSNKEYCILCGCTGNLTGDNVPPGCLFPSPAPTDLIRVPACYKCNNSYSKDDEYLRVFLTSRLNRNDTAEKIWKEKVVKSTFVRSPKLRERLKKTIKRRELVTASGLYLHTFHTIDWESKRLTREFEKIIRGLYYKEKESFLPTSVRFDFIDHSNFDMEPEILVFYANSKEKMVGSGDVFFYRYQLDEKDAATGIWWLLFYRSTMICGIHEAPETDQSILLE